MSIIMEGTTLFPMQKNQKFFNNPYPGISNLTEEGLKQLITEAVFMSSPPWPTTRSYTLQVEFPVERHGIKEMEIWINPNGIEYAYPTKGSQVFKWYNNKWNPMG